MEDHPGPIPKCKPAPSESLRVDLEDHGIMTFPREKVRRSKVESPRDTRGYD